ARRAPRAPSRSPRLRLAHFGKDIARCRQRVAGFGDGPPDDDVVGASRDCLRRRDDALLIAVRRTRWTDAGREREEVVAEKALEIAGFVRAAYDPGTPGIARQGGETNRILAGSSLQSEFVEIFGSDARENRDREHL